MRKQSIVALGSVALSLLLGCGGSQGQAGPTTAANDASGSSRDTASSVSSDSASGSKAATPSEWPTGKLKIDKFNETLTGGDSELDVSFFDPSGKHHAIVVQYGFTSAEIIKATFDDQVVDSLPKYRALAKYLVDTNLCSNSRGLQVLECTHAWEDHVNDTDPQCKGWVDPGGGRRRRPS